MLILIVILTVCSLNLLISSHCFKIYSHCIVTCNYLLNLRKKYINLKNLCWAKIIFLREEFTILPNFVKNSNNRKSSCTDRFLGGTKVNMTKSRDFRNRRKLSLTFSKFSFCVTLMLPDMTKH